MYRHHATATFLYIVMCVYTHIATAALASKVCESASERARERDNKVVIECLMMCFAGQHTQHQMQEQLQRKDDDILSLSNIVQSHMRQVNHHQQQQKEGEVGNADASAPDKDKEPSTMEVTPPFYEPFLRIFPQSLSLSLSLCHILILTPSVERTREKICAMTRF
jgi:hypothetical protein